MIIGILNGMALTLKEALFGKRVTVQYPFEKSSRPYRGKHDVDKEKCILCRMCERTCPNGSISITLKEGREKTRSLHDYHYKVDAGTCMWCGACEDVCPRKIVNLTDEFNMAGYKKENLIFEVE